MSQPTTSTATTTPAPTVVIAPGRPGAGRRSYLTRWEIDDVNGAELAVMRSEGGYYCACFYPVTFDRTTTGRMAGVISEPMAYLHWRLETTARYSTKRLREINEAVTAVLVEHLAATSPKDAAVLARAGRAGALGAMNAAASHLRATFPDAAPYCATDAAAGWTCLSITYPSGNPRTHAHYREDDCCWEVSAFPDEHLATPHHEDLDVTDADLAAAIESHHRRTF